MAPELSQFGPQGLRFSQLSLRSAVISVASDPRIPALLKQGRGKGPPRVRASDDFSKSCSTSDLAVVNRKREASLGERVDLSVSCNKKGSIAVRKWYYIEDNCCGCLRQWRPTHHHIFHYRRLSRLPLSLIPVYFHPNVLGD